MLIFVEKFQKCSMGGCCGKSDETEKDAAGAPAASQEQPPMDAGQEPPPPEAESLGGDQAAAPPPTVGGGQTDLSAMGIEDFRQRLGELAPTTPLIILFMGREDDQQGLTSTLSSLAESYPNVIFLKASMDKNDKAAREFGVQSTPTWMAFKNHVPNGSYEGADQGGAESLVQQQTNT